MAYIGPSKPLVEAALSLSESLTVKADFLGAEVADKSDAEQSYELAWKALGAGELSRAVELSAGLLRGDAAHEKAYFTRAIAYARLGEWGHAAADYSSYLRLNQAASGPARADALYGRALCMAKLGHRAPALRDLSECIRVGPHDEQLGERGASNVPRAVVGMWAMLQAFPELAAKQRAGEAAMQRAEGEAAEGVGGGEEEEPCYEGKVWRVPITAFEEALTRAIGEGKTPLLMDTTEQKVCDKYFLYAPATIVEAKRMVVNVRMCEGKLDDALEGLRKELLHAMRYGHFLVIRMANSAPDFLKTYCTDDCFPKAVFDQKAWPSGKDASKDPFFRMVLRGADTAKNGTLNVPDSFRVVVTSTFKSDMYEQLLHESLPLDLLQPIELREASARARMNALAAEGASNSGPLSGVLADWGGDAIMYDQQRGTVCMELNAQPNEGRRTESRPTQGRPDVPLSV